MMCTLLLLILSARWAIHRYHYMWEPEGHNANVWTTLRRAFRAAKYTGCINIGGADGYERLWSSPLYRHVVQFEVDKPHEREEWWGGSEKVKRLYSEVIQGWHALGIRRLIIWGLDKDHGPGHTHRYIHLAWFRSLIDIVMHDVGDQPFQVCWFDETSALDAGDVEHSLIFTSPSHGSWMHKGLPRLPDDNDSTFFVLHSIPESDITMELFESKNIKKSNVIFWTVHGTVGVRKSQSKWNNVENSNYIYWMASSRRLHIPWASDQTPWEIEIQKSKVVTRYSARRKSESTSTSEGSEKTIGDRLADLGASRDIVFVGTVWPSNAEEIRLMVAAAEHLGLRFVLYGEIWTIDAEVREAITRSPAFFHADGRVSSQKAQQAFLHAAIAPAIQGANQVTSQYVPCRIFKTTGAGALGVSNNEALKDLFPGPEPTIVARPTLDAKGFERLFAEAAAINLDTATARQRTLRTMDIVKEDHTYLSRFAVCTRMLQMKGEQD